MRPAACIAVQRARLPQANVVESLQLLQLQQQLVGRFVVVRVVLRWHAGNRQRDLAGIDGRAEKTGRASVELCVERNLAGDGRVLRLAWGMCAFPFPADQRHAYGERVVFKQDISARVQAFVLLRVAGHQLLDRRLGRSSEIV